MESILIFVFFIDLHVYGYLLNTASLPSVFKLYDEHESRLAFDDHEPEVPSVLETDFEEKSQALSDCTGSSSESEPDHEADSDSLHNVEDPMNSAGAPRPFDCIESPSILSELSLNCPILEGSPFSKSMYVAINFLLSLSNSTASLSLALQCIGAFFPSSSGLEKLKWSNLKRVVYRKARKSPYSYENIPVCQKCGYLQCTTSMICGTPKRKQVPFPCSSCQASVPPKFFLRIFPFVAQIRTVVESFSTDFCVESLAIKLEKNRSAYAGDTIFSPRFRLRFQSIRSRYPNAKYIAFAGLWHDGFGQTKSVSSHRKNLWPISFCFFNLSPSQRIRIPNVCLLALVPGPSQPPFRWLLKFLFDQIDYFNSRGGFEFRDKDGSIQKVIVSFVTSANDMPALTHAWELPTSIFIFFFYYIRRILWLPIWGDIH